MNNKTEFKIGEEVQLGLVTLVCEEEKLEHSCDGCYAMHKNGICDLIGECREEFRTDKKSVIFKRKDNGKD